VKNDLVSFVSIIGLVLLATLVTVGATTGVLFMFPNISIFGAKAVMERDTQIVYRDDELTQAFAQGRFIIESTGTQIEVKMSNDGYQGEGTIVVNESATGIAFNSLNRTLVQWTQTIYNNLPYYRIKILEPSGVVFKDEPTIVYINLPHRSKSSSFKHDFVLQNQYSDVNFSYVDNSVSASDALKIGSLIVESAASVNILTSQNSSIETIDIKGSKIKLNCQAEEIGNVTVEGAEGTQTFHGEIDGVLKIKGKKNNFNGNTAGAVEVISPNGNLKLNTAESLKVNSNANVSVETVENGIEMLTESGKLDVNEVLAGGIKFTAGFEDKRNATASLKVDNVIGAVNVINYGTGSINLANVIGDVYIKSSEEQGGDINVHFRKSDKKSNVTIRGYDGDINVSGINGLVDIEIRNWENGAGAANVTAQFDQVVGTGNVIKVGGYMSGHHDWGNVNLKLNSEYCNSFNMYVYGASSANSSSKYGYDENNMIIETDLTKEAKANKIRVPEYLGFISGALTVYCKQSVYLE